MFLSDHYWKSWIRKYMPTLQRRSKWVKSGRNVFSGDLVLIAEDNVVLIDSHWAVWSKCSLERTEGHVQPESKQLLVCITA